MKDSIKKAVRFTLILLPVAALAGLFTGMYTFEAYTDDVRQQILAQVNSYSKFLFTTTLQSALYAAVCGFLGHLLAQKIGLIRKFSFEKSKLLPTLAATLVCGVLFSLDYWTFAKWIPQLAETYSSLVTVENFLSSVLYGGVIEEVLMRLFLMSLFVFLGWKLFFRKNDRVHIPEGVFVAANILTAMLFAAGHLPATVSLFGDLTPLIVFRCFLLNGGLGLVFGRLYRKYGIQYAMLCHAGCHIISKAIWILFI